MSPSSAGTASDQPGARQQPVGREPRWHGFFCGALIALAVLAAYGNSFSGAFVYDDVFTIVDNPAMRHLWPSAAAAAPTAENGLPIAGRPLVGLSLALNYAVGGSDVRGYHAVNLLIHALGALVLFGMVRRTLIRQGGRNTTATAGVAALLWVMHPLQTESVTYIVQRAESLMGLCYLLTFYGFVRGAESAAPGRWFALAFAACGCGMACKEVMVTAPLLVLLYDRAFVAGSWQEAWRQRSRFYLALASTWLVLAYLVVATGSRGGTAGFGAGAAWWRYAATQGWAVVHYLRLCGWPHPLIFDYGTEPVELYRQIVPDAAIMVVLLAGTVVALWRNTPAGFLGAWFFGVLAPSSSVVPVVTEIAAEHRMYLPLAAVTVAVAVGLHRGLGRRGLAIGAALTAVLGTLTWQRNADYRSERAIWSATVASRPGNARAHFNLGVQLAAAGRVPEAVAEFQGALRIRPDFASAHSSLSDVLRRSDDLAGARRHAEAALRLNPGLAEAHNNLGSALLLAGDLAGALREYMEAVRLQPDDAEMRNNLGTALTQAGRLADAIGEYQAALKLKPGAAIAHFNLANTFARSGRFAEAILEYQETLRLDANHPMARENLNRARQLQQARPPGN